MNYRLNGGLLRKIKGNGVEFSLPMDNIYVTCDKKTYYLKDIKCIQQNNGHFVYQTKHAFFDISYKKVEDSNFIKRKIRMSFSEPVTLKKIGFTVNSNEFDRIFLYKVFYNASGVIFGRSGSTGIAMGFENPFFELKGDNIEFEPNIALKENEIFDCDDNFFGIYKLRGEYFRPILEKSQIENNGRFLPCHRNPGEGIDLNANEIDEFNKYTNNYFKIRNKEFLFKSFTPMSNLPENPQSKEEIFLYKNHINNFAKMGGDAIILNPFDVKEPTKDTPYWELFAENTPFAEIFSEAASKGLKIGAYIKNNSSLNSYDNETSWKKTDKYGNLSEENCIASDDFCSWYIQSIKNTIKKYNLKIWCFCPGPGNGFFCYSKDHGHLPGKGNYKGFRNMLKIMKEIKDEFPTLNIEIYKGCKEYGLWGYKYADQHEGHWKPDIDELNPIFPDISPDRLTGDIIRYFGNENYLYSFMPYALNQGVCHRAFQNQINNTKDCDLLFDRNGYKFALLSAIAAGGSVSIPIIPRKPELIPGYFDFYKLCINWAKAHWEYSKNTILFNNLDNYGGEAYSKIVENEGFLFLVNPYPMPINFSFVMDERIGFTPTEDNVNINYYWPMEQNYVENVEYKEKISVVIPPYSIPVLEVTHNKAPKNNFPMDKALPRFLNLTKKTKKGFVYRFFGDPLIKKYIESQQKYIYKEVLEAGEKFCEYKGSDSSHWFKPDRLWMHVLHTEHKPKITINDLILDLKPFELKNDLYQSESGYFVDITDMIIWNGNNTIEAEGNEEPWLFLTYPRPEEELPNDISHDIEKYIPKSPVLDQSVSVLNVQLNEDNIMNQNDTNIIRCRVNTDRGKLEGVYASVPVGGNIRHDVILNYRDGIWEAGLDYGSRKDLIIDDEKIVVWAVTLDGKESEGFILPFDWAL